MLGNYPFFSPTADDAGGPSEALLVAEYELYLDFEKNIGDPQRIFKTLSRVLDVLAELDTLLARTLDTRLRTHLVLADVQAGSLRSIVKVFLESIPEDGLKELDWKKIVGGYLNKGRLAAIKALENKPEFTSVAEINNLKDHLDTLARQTELDPMNAYGTLNKGLLADTLDDITKAVSPLRPGDYLEYRSAEGNARFNPRFNTANFSQLVSEGEQTTRQTVRLRIKKPDFLGESRWEFRLHDRKLIEAKILDTAWLQRFHNGEIQIKSGDLLEVELQADYIHGPNYQSAVVHYSIPHVTGVVSPPHTA